MSLFVNPQRKDSTLLNLVINGDIATANNILDDDDANDADDNNVVASDRVVCACQRILAMAIQTWHISMMSVFTAMQQHKIDIGDTNLSRMIKTSLDNDDSAVLGPVLAHCRDKLPGDTIQNRLSITDSEWQRITSVYFMPRQRVVCESSSTSLTSSISSSSSLPPFECDDNASNEIIRLCANHNVANALSIFAALATQSRLCSTKACNALIMKMRKSYPVKEIVAIYCYMKEYRIARNIYTYNGMMSAYKFAKNSYGDAGVESIIRDMAHDNVTYDSCTCTILAPWYDRRNDCNMVVALFDNNIDAICADVSARDTFVQIFALRKIVEYRRRGELIITRCKINVR